MSYSRVSKALGCSMHAKPPSPLRVVCRDCSTVLNDKGMF